MSVLESLMENGVDAEDLEKAASARLFINACTEEGIDLDQHSDEEVEAAYESWFDENYGGGEKYASDEEVEEATAKLAEAEILGRHMARAYMAEMEKDATSQATKMKQRALGFNGPRGGTDSVKDRAKIRDARSAAKAKGNPRSSNLGAFLAKRKAAQAAAPAPGRMARLGGAIMRNKGKSALIGAGLLGAGAGGLALARHRKNASTEAFDDLATNRAYEILQANGFEFEDGGDELDEAVDARAIELLEDAGYSFE